MANNCNCGCDDWCFGSCSIQVRDAYRTTPGSGAGTGVWPQLTGVYDTISMKLCVQLYRCDDAYEEAKNKPLFPFVDIPAPENQCYVNISGLDMVNLGDTFCPPITGIPLRAWEEGVLEDTFCANIAYVIPNVNTGTLIPPHNEQCYAIYYEVVCDSGIEPFSYNRTDNPGVTDPCVSCANIATVCIDNVKPEQWRGPWDDESGKIYPTNANPNWIPVRRKAQEWQNTYPDQSGVYKGGYVTPSGLGGF
jgi:hypothetical protein